MRKQRGFTLIELLIVVAIIGIIAAIAIPALMDAMERAHQKATMADINSIATAIQSFSTDMRGTYPLFAAGDPFVNFGGATGAGWVSAGVVPGNVFVPNYIQHIPQYDGWGTTYSYLGAPTDAGTPWPVNDPIGVARADRFCLWSKAKLGANSVGTGEVGGAATGAAVSAAWCVAAPVVSGTMGTHCYNTDIVWCDSAMVQAPEGKQTNCGGT